MNVVWFWLDEKTLSVNNEDWWNNTAENNSRDIPINCKWNFSHILNYETVRHKSLRIYQKVATERGIGISSGT